MNDTETIFERRFRGHLDDALIIASVIAPGGDVGSFMEREIDFALARLGEQGLVQRFEEED